MRTISLKCATQHEWCVAHFNFGKTEWTVSSTPMAGRGAPSSPVWQAFVRLPQDVSTGETYVRCLFCRKELYPNAKRLGEHLNTQKCCKAGGKVASNGLERAQILDAVDKFRGRSTPKRRAAARLLRRNGTGRTLTMSSPCGAIA